MFDADTLTEGVIGFDLGGEFALGVNGKGQRDALALCELVSEVAKDFGAGDGGLIREDGVAVLVADGLALEVEPAGVDGGVKAPCVEGEREVVADPGDFILGSGLFKEGIGVGTVGALQVFELDHGHAGASWWVQGCRVLDRSSLRRRRELGADAGDEKCGAGEGKEHAGTAGAGEGRLGDSREARHGGWMAPFGSL